MTATTESGVPESGVAESWAVRSISGRFAEVFVCFFFLGFFVDFSGCVFLVLGLVLVTDGAAVGVTLDEAMAVFRVGLGVDVDELV